ncbi:Ger(x)C family spore germination protein [Domibacillus sp. DTU_2020_1001157_1_SI_ALB_TIR_016]|uniref:Ger(x)C family spore germination protein n=1 Tax=Domibacillus sp. DTU_2020_1001157_1_SI_ALB_TIR_016 TaxID=3077789 RepID=UPI0028E9C94D|nr:Ger(x)C family spore germination protein [Domibacillus sp. DTU_2020_1001157_1_SI_ALB_TIR_016]WNS81335.1 Ger(x)C family spore germination protein [Domibacillus sp. DTU_2020_1001157_1_SI_ALB_TIR_016]
MRKWWTIIPLSLLLAGCWDQKSIKDLNLIFGVGIDREEENNLTLTVEIPQENQGTTSGGGGTEGQTMQAAQSLIMSEKGQTVRDVAYKMDRGIDGALDISKLSVLMVGKESAQNDLYSLLDAYFRNPVSPLNAKLLVVDGRADEFFQKDFKGQTLYSDYFFKLIETAEQESAIPVTNMQLACNLLLDEGSDGLIPLISYNEEQRAAEINGSALFNGRSMSGELTAKETSSFLIMVNQAQQELPLTFRVEGGEDISVMVIDSKAKLKVNVPKNGNPTATVSVDMEVQVIEYPPDHLEKEKVVKSLNQQLTEEAEKLFQQTVQKMQEANSDTLGIGRRIIAKDPDAFKKLDWGEVYPDMDIKVETKVKIERTGAVF